jgi:RND family efflux transporter MFP subunit
VSRRSIILVGGALVLAATVGAMATRSWWSPAVAQAPQRPQAPRAVPVEIAQAARQRVPLVYDALGTVTPIRSVAIKPRLETVITEVQFTDGASVKQGELLFTLDGRHLEAQIRQAEGVVARDRAQLDGAERDLKRYSELIARGATTTVNLDNAKTQVDVLGATLKANQSALENLRVQLSYTRIYAPISGRIGAASVKVGNFVRPADVAPLATLNQMAPVYVAFAAPQRLLVEIREAVLEGTSKVEASVGGEGPLEGGRIAMIDNSVDASTGMVTIRAVMDNARENLWPGTLVNTRLTLRVEDAITVPVTALQRGQAGTFVFVVKDGAALVQAVTVSRTFEGAAIVTKGLSAGDTVVTDGQLLLANGTKVQPRQARS